MILLLVPALTILGQVPEGTAIRNIAQVNYRSAGGVSYSGETNEVELLVASGYQVEIQTCTSASVLSPGDTLTYQIQLKNTGNMTLPYLSIIDTLGSELEPLFTTQGGEIEGQRVSWSLSDLEPGDSRIVALSVRAALGLSPGLKVVNFAWYTLDNDMNGTSNPSVITIGESSELRSSITVDKAVADMGDTLIYKIEVENRGNQSSEMTQLFNDFPDYTSFLSASQNVTLNKGIITWSIGDIEAGEIKKQTIQLKLHDFTPLNTRIVSNVHVSNSELKSSSSEVFTLVNPWSLPLHISAEARDYMLGDTILYTLTLDNDSQWEISHIVVKDSLPQGLKFLSASDGAEYAAPFVTWSLGSMAHHSSKTLYLETVLDSSGAVMNDITNIASVMTYNARFNSISLSRSKIVSNSEIELLFKLSMPAWRPAGRLSGSRLRRWLPFATPKNSY